MMGKFANPSAEVFDQVLVDLEKEENLSFLWETRPEIVSPGQVRTGPGNLQDVSLDVVEVYSGHVESLVYSEYRTCVLYF